MWSLVEVCAEGTPFPRGPTKWSLRAGEVGILDINVTERRCFQEPRRKKHSRPRFLVFFTVRALCFGEYHLESLD